MLMRVALACWVDVELHVVGVGPPVEVDELPGVDSTDAWVLVDCDGDPSRHHLESGVADGRVHFSAHVGDCGACHAICGW